jgi:hypothetical protein
MQCVTFLDTRLEPSLFQQIDLAAEYFRKVQLHPAISRIGIRPAISPCRGAEQRQAHDPGPFQLRLMSAKLGCEIVAIHCFYFWG